MPNSKGHHIHLRDITMIAVPLLAVAVAWGVLHAAVDTAVRDIDKQGEIQETYETRLRSVEHMTERSEADFRAMDRRQETIERSLSKISESVDCIKESLSEIKVDTAKIKSDVSHIDSDVKGVKIDVQGLKTDVATIKRTTSTRDP